MGDGKKTYLPRPPPTPPVGMHGWGGGWVGGGWGGGLGKKTFSLIDGGIRERLLNLRYEPVYDPEDRHGGHE